MRRIWRQSVTVLAAYAVALHVILLGFAPIAQASSVDTLSVICHSSATSPDDESSGQSHLVPGKVCDHCKLCSSIAAPPVPAIVVFSLMPTQLLQVMRPASQALGALIAFRPNLARGPPLFV